MSEPIEIQKLRQWAFEKALECRSSSDRIETTIQSASEIEAYVSDGSNPLELFKSCVAKAVQTVSSQGVVHVGNDKTRKVIEELVEQLRCGGVL